jgi:hypothetical protein
MAERERKNWRELCHAALGPRDPDELLKTVQELNHALSSERGFRPSQMWGAAELKVKR